MYSSFLTSDWLPCVQRNFRVRASCTFRQRIHVGRPSAKVYSKPVADARGRDPEFSVKGPVFPLGINWEQWRQGGETGNVPILPFDAEEVMLPGEEKILHLYEARYLSLFDEALSKYDAQFAHVLLSRKRQALAASGTLVRVVEWKRLEIGVQVKLEALGRLVVSSVDQTTLPFMTGSVTFLDDVQDESARYDLLTMETEFWNTAETIAFISAKLDISPTRPKAELVPVTLAEEFLRSAEISTTSSSSIQVRVETCLSNLRAAVKRASWPCEDLSPMMNDCEGGKETYPAYQTHCRLRALSFVAFELFPSLPRERQQAQELMSTKERMKRSLGGCRSRRRLLEAQLALRSAFPSEGDSSHEEP